MSSQTRVTIAPTVRQATLIRAAVAVLEQVVASQATWWSKSAVCPAPARAQGMWQVTTPQPRQDTRGASAWMNTISIPASRCRQRRPGVPGS